VVVENGNFQRFAGYFFGNFRDEACVIMLRYTVHHLLFSDPEIHDLEWLLYVKFCFHAGLADLYCATFEKYE